MSCATWRDLLMLSGVDELDPDKRLEFLSHLQGCTACRRAAAEADPTIVFSLLPQEAPENDEVEEIRRTVQTMRRVRAMESSWSPRVRQGLAMGAFAALVLAAVVGMPRQQEQTTFSGVPFAGALGVGSGLVAVPQATAGTWGVELELELARSSQIASLSNPPELHAVSHLNLSARAGEQVDRALGSGYRVRFNLPEEESMVDSPVLRGFQVLRTGEDREVPLLEADLHPQPNSPLVLGLSAADKAEEQLWLLVTYRPEKREKPARD